MSLLYVRLPMMCTRACQSVSTIHAVTSSSMLSKTHSNSPFGPLTNPSTETDIFRISFRIVISPHWDVEWRRTKSTCGSEEGWCAQRDSNPRPTAPENDAQFPEK